MSGIINVNKVVDLMGDKNHYTYIRVKNLLSGLKGRSSKKDIQQLRRLINKELTAIDNTLHKLENE
jgi:hypothetical protein